MSTRRRFAAAPAVAVVYGVCALHYAWAALLFYSPVAAHSTPVSAVVTIFGGRFTGAAALLVSGLLAQAAPFTARRYLPWVLVPQQVILLVSAAAGVYAAYQGKYADGVHRGWPFIAGDQAPVVLVTVLYAAALWSMRPRAPQPEPAAPVTARTISSFTSGVVFVAASLILTILLTAAYTTYAVGSSQAKWCDTLNLLTARPVPRPANPAANPSREQAYVFYADFITLKGRLGCG